MEGTVVMARSSRFQLSPQLLAVRAGGLRSFYLLLAAPTTQSRPEVWSETSLRVGPRGR